MLLVVNGKTTKSKFLSWVTKEYSVRSINELSSKQLETLCAKVQHRAQSVLLENVVTLEQVA